MKTKAIADLTQLSDPDFFSEVSAGLDHTLQSAVGLEQAAALLADQGHTRGYRILLRMAEEEAAKFLILLDAVRCPRTPPEQLGQHLKRIYNHLVKKIYADACDWKPSTLGELLEYTENERREFYLDGPNDVDWIFWNRVLEKREREIYVDYVDTDEGHVWFTPPEDEPDGLWLIRSPSALQLAQALDASGCTSPESLDVIAKLWRPVEITVNYRWVDLRALNLRTLQELDDLNLLRGQPQDTYAAIADKWTFPLHSAELKLARVKRSVLREIQDQWSPDGWRR
jgi:hypothetical protein